MTDFPPEHNHFNSSRLLLTLGSGIVLISTIVLMCTNPSEQEYEEFATEQLVIYAKENLCSANSSYLEEAVKSQVCKSMVDTGRVKIPNIIKETTSKRNYLLFSVYETDLLLYEFQTLGFFHSFYIIDVFGATRLEK